MSSEDNMQRIALHSVPRSGSSWLGHLIDSCPEVIYKYQPLFSYALKDFLDECSSKARVDEFFSRLATTEDDFMDQKAQIASGKAPNFVKETPRFIAYKEVRYHHILSNLLKVDQDIKIIGLIRNPLSVISSWLKAPKEFKQELGWIALEEWRYAPSKNLNKKEEFNGFEKWKEVALLFESLAQEYPNRFILIEYRSLLEETLSTVTKLFEFLGIPLTKQTLDFITESQTKQIEDAYAVYRKNQRDDKWKIALDPIITEAIIKELKETSLYPYLYLDR